MNNAGTARRILFQKARVPAVGQCLSIRESDTTGSLIIGVNLITNRRQAEDAVIALQLPRRSRRTIITPMVIENDLIALHLERATCAAANAAEATDPFAQAYHHRHSELEYHAALSILELPKHLHTTVQALCLNRRPGAPRWTFFQFGRCDRCGVRLAGTRSLRLPNAGLRFCAQCGRLDMDAFEAHHADQSNP